MQITHRIAMKMRAIVVSALHRGRLREMAKKKVAPAMVAFYHRVANSNPNPWTISSEDFRRHLDHFQSLGQFVGLAEVQRRMREGVSANPCFSISFDDGYAENALYALPLLIERGIPVAYFVSTDHIRYGTPFQHDVDAGVPLAVHSPSELRQLATAGVSIGCHTRNHVDFSKIEDPQLIDEQIIEDKDRLEQMIGQRVAYFAFPYGLPAQLKPKVIDAVYRAGFDGFCSAFGGYNLVGQDWFHIRRFHGDPEFSRLVNWTSFDSRKVQMEPHIDYPQRSLFLPQYS
jgi:peptidoglycan/xylan/chitin deacetylase (PgdA/CDA1 family)